MESTNRSGPLLLLAALTCLLGGLSPSAQAQGTNSAGVAFPTFNLPSNSEGSNIPTALGTRSGELAGWYGLSTAEFNKFTSREKGLRADKKARLHYACSALPVAAGTSSGSSTTSTPPYATTQTFLLHSRPTSTKKIYLDFGGHTTSGTSWNSTYTANANIVTPPYDIDGSPSTLSSQEHANIQTVWQQVAEDYIAFDVDVTTEDPGVEALQKTTTSDVNYGKRVVIGGSSMDWLGTAVGGIAYISSFNWNIDTPVFVFPAQLSSGDPKDIAESCAHEVGHTLGLHHDGTNAGGEYYEGNGNWAPIMGAGYYASVVQWSKGEYPDATNLEDDVAIIAGMLPLITDDVGNTTALAKLLTGTSIQTSGVISSAADQDVFIVNSGAGTISLSLATAAPSPDLCAQLSIANASGQVIATSTPSINMGTTLSVTVTAGSYYVTVSGVALADWTTGFGDYGSEGQYILTGTVPSAGTAPIAVVSSSAPLSGTAPVNVGFSSTGSYDPDGSIASYSWNFGDGTTSAAASPSHSYSTAGTYVATLTVKDNAGLAGAASTTITVTNNLPPTATATASATTGAAPLTINFTSTASDPEKTALTYLWNFGDGTSATTATASHAYTAAGTYAPKLTVTDAAGLSTIASTATITVTAGNLPPVAKATATPASNFVSTAIAFSSAGSSDPEGGALTYLWTFGDGTTSTTASPSKSYTTAGNYNVTLKVTDNKAAATTASLVVIVAAKAVYVADVVVSLVTVNTTTWGAKATVTVKDALGNLKGGVKVTGSWSGVYAKTGVTATTGTSGTALGVGTINSTTSTKKGTYTFTITGLTLSGFTYDKTKNVKSAGSIATPP